MRFHILVTPYDDEPLVTSLDTARAGRAWLDEHTEVWEPFPQTGGYMILAAESRAALDELLSTYPLLPTVTLAINQVVSHDEGFGTLYAAIEQRRHIEVPT